MVVGRLWERLQPRMRPLGSTTCELFADKEGVAKLSVAPLWERIYPRMTPQVIDFWQSIRG